MRLRAIALVGAVLSGTVLVGGVANAGAAPLAPKPKALTKASIIKSTKLVGDYWAKNGTNLAALNWQNSTFHVGNLAAVTAGGVSNHVTRPWAQANKFALPNDGGSPYYPDNLAPGEVYLSLLPFHADTPLGDLRRRAADETKEVIGGHPGFITYADGLNLTLPALARLGVLDKNQNMLTAMHTLFTNTEKMEGGTGLYDESQSLWWRDKDFAGTNTYWSRGNGFAIAAVAKVANALPASDARRAEYLRVLKNMAAKLKTLQRSDGFWNADLTNPNNFGGPETSGTVFITYALAWGIHNKVLPAADYQPVVEKAWQGLTTVAVAKDGRLGYVQGPAVKPADSQPVKATDQAAYGVGGFLLAGAELSTLYK
jgi:unsaturated rhamnogalacturonyl hydrolase